MDGMSDTSLDSDLYCRLRALIRLNFRQDPKAENLLNRLDRITFWKKGIISMAWMFSVKVTLYSKQLVFFKILELFIEAISVPSLDGFTGTGLLSATVTDTLKQNITLAEKHCD